MESESNNQRNIRRSVSANNASEMMSTFNTTRDQSVQEEPSSAFNSFSHRMSIANASRSRMSILSTRQTPTLQPQPKVAKPFLNVRDQLNIIRRFRSGEYNKTKGFEQFEDEKRDSGSIHAPINLDESTSSKGSGKSDEIKIGDLIISQKEYPNLAKFFMEPETNESYAKNPAYIKACDKLIVGILFLHREIRAGATAMADRTLALHLPPKEIIPVHRGIARITKIVQKYASISTNRLYGLFEPPKSSSDETMKFPLVDQKNFVECVKEASILLDKMNTYLGREDAPDYEDKMRKLDNFATRLEEKLKILDKSAAEATKLAETVKELCPIEFDSACEEEDGNFFINSDSSTYTTDSSMERVGDD